MSLLGRRGLKGRDGLVDDLYREISFLHRTIDGLRKENKQFKVDLKLFEDIVRENVKVVYDRYDPKKFSQMYKLIDGEALKICKTTGKWFYWKELYDRLVKLYRFIDWNPETVRRRCQLAVNEGLLTRVKPGTYIYNIHR